MLYETGLMETVDVERFWGCLWELRYHWLLNWGAGFPLLLRSYGEAGRQLTPTVWSTDTSKGAAVKGLLLSQNSFLIQTYYCLCSINISSASGRCPPLWVQHVPFLLQAVSCVSLSMCQHRAFSPFLVGFFFSSCNHFAISFPLYIIKSFLDENVELLVNTLKMVSHRMGSFL